MPPFFFFLACNVGVDVVGMAAEVESSHQDSIAFCCCVTDGSGRTVWQNGVWHGSVYEESQNCLGWKGPQWSSSFNPPAMCRVTNHHTRLPRATSSLALNASRDGASTTSLGNMLQCVTNLWVKNFLLISNLNLPCLSLKSFPFVLSLSTLVNSHCPSCFYAPFKYWKATMRSSQSLLFSKLNKPSSLNLSS